MSRTDTGKSRAPEKAPVMLKLLIALFTLASFTTGDELVVQPCLWARL
jgi:hypothetical protein